MLSTLSRISAIYLLACQTAYAEMPTAPSVGGVSSSDGSILKWFKGLMSEGIVILGFAIAAVGFVWVSWIVISDVNQARTGRKEWGEVGLTAIAGALALLFVSYLLAKATGIIEV